VNEASRPARRSAWEVQRAVLFALFLRELKTRLGGRWMGVFWLLLEPVAHIAVMTTLFSLAHRATLPSIDYPVFLITGLIPFFLFRGLVTRLMEAIDANRGLFAYRQVKPIDTVIARALLEIALQSTVYLIALATLGWLGFDFLPARALELCGVSAVLVLLGASLGLFFGVATNEVPQARAIVRISLLPLYFISGVIFPVHAIPPQYLSLLQLNPVLHLIELSRACFFPQYHVLAGINLAYPAALALFSTFLALVLYRLRRQRLASVV
jgi:capsular polysaccharide transport system permease protein